MNIFKNNEEIEFSKIMKLFTDQGEDLTKVYDPAQLLFYKNLQKNILWLDDEISWETCAFLIQWLQTLTEDDPPVELHIMSYGGELDTMFCLYNTIKDCKVPVTTINEGACHSAAFIIFLAGQKRIFRPDATSIAHEGSAQLGGSHRETREAMRRYEAQIKRMKEIMAEETGISFEMINERFDKESDWHIDYNTAKELGIIKE